MKVLCVLYDDPTNGMPEDYALDNLPVIEKVIREENTKKLRYCNCANNRYGTYQFNNKCHCILDRPSDYVYVPQLFQNYR